MKDEQILLNVAAVAAPSTCNGPGKRVVIWVQGCTIGCRGCFNKDMQPHVPKHLVEPHNFARFIVDEAAAHDCEGVTISGGEPFQQSPALLEFCHGVRMAGLSIVVFSGYHKDALFSDVSEHVKRLLDNIDILISGPYNDDNRQIRTWLHDDDKKVSFLNGRYDKTRVYDEACSEFLYSDNGIVTSGFIDLTRM